MSFEPRTTCPSCGSNDVSVGGTDESLPDYEMSRCNNCGSSWGGANFWK